MIPIAMVSGAPGHHDGNHIHQAPPHIANPGDGDRLILSTAGFFMVDVITSNGIDAPMVILVHPQIMTGLSCVLDADSCREIGKQMMEAANKLEAGARLAANAALRKAAGK